MKKVELKSKRRLRRKRTIRKKIFGTSVKPRLSVFKSNKYIYVQVIDDEKGVTLTSSSNLKFDPKANKLNKGTSEKVGVELGHKLKELKIAEAVFDRNGFIYAGKIKVLADAIRKQGIKF